MSTEASADQAAVMDLLQSNRNPLVAICAIGQTQFVRSMGVVIECFSGGLRVVATCKHEAQIGPILQRLVGMKNPKPTNLACIGEPIGDPDEETDVAFLVVRDPLDAPTQPFLVPAADPMHPPGKRLYNARNDCEPARRLYGVDITYQPVIETEEAGYTKFSTGEIKRIPASDIEAGRALYREGFRRQRLFNMISRPAYSGSPIWDDNLTLYGLDVGGSAPTEAGEADFTLCLPVATLQKARRRAEPLIRRRLRSARS